MYVVQASEGSQGAKNTFSSRTCLTLRVCLALALRLPRTCLRSPCKTLKMQANCYPPPPPPKRTTSYPLTSVVLEMKDYFDHEQANLLPSRASLWELHHSPTRKPLSEEELSENEAGCNRSFFIFSSWTTEYSVENTLPKAISTHVCIITGH